jgi:hypothetical protein
MDKASFVQLELIQNHDVFKSDSRHKQEDPYYQLMIVLSRLGCNGNGAAAAMLECQEYLMVQFANTQIESLQLY